MGHAGGPAPWRWREKAGQRQGCGGAARGPEGPGRSACCRPRGLDPSELGAGGGRLPGKQGIVTAVSEEHHSVHAVGSPTQGRAALPPRRLRAGARAAGRTGPGEDIPREPHVLRSRPGPRTSQQHARLQLEESLAPSFAATGAARGPGT